MNWDRFFRAGARAPIDPAPGGDPDACLLDFRLGATTGLEVLTAVREAGVDTPIVLLTGQSDRETDLQAMAAGASDYLVKGSFDALGKTYTIDSQCQLIEQNRSIIEAAMLLVWAIAAIFIVLRA